MIRSESQIGAICLDVGVFFINLKPNMNIPDLSYSTPDQLRTILLTCDGQGKDTKGVALKLLIEQIVTDSHGYVWTPELQAQKYREFCAEIS